MQLTELRSKTPVLQPNERESLVHDLLDSLHEDSNLTIDDTWLAEIDRRMADVKDGKVTMLPYSQFREEVGRKFD